MTTLLSRLLFEVMPYYYFRCDETLSVKEVLDHFADGCVGVPSLTVAETLEVHRLDGCNEELVQSVVDVLMFVEDAYCFLVDFIDRIKMGGAGIGSGYGRKMTWIDGCSISDVG